MRWSDGRLARPVSRHTVRTEALLRLTPCNFVYPREMRCVTRAEIGSAPCSWHRCSKYRRSERRRSEHQWQQRRSPLAAPSSQLWPWLASILQMAEAQSSRSLDWAPLSILDRDKHRPQVIPGTRLRSNPPPVRFLDRPAETRTACPARFVT